MLLVGGKQGLKSFLSLAINFSVIFMTVVLIGLDFPIIGVTLLNATIILAVTIYLGDDDPVTTETAFYGSMLVMVVIVILIIPVEHWATVQGFGNENTEDLEGLSLLVGIKFLDVSIATTILSSLGAIAEAAMAISAGLGEILTQNPDIAAQQLFKDGMGIGKQIIGTTFNTLFFGFFGGFLGLFIWFERLSYTFGELLNNKIFVSELLMILISFIGVILTIPITTWVMRIKVSRKSRVRK
ncbi:Integral membrane protein [Pediococcus damnosus]|uniref:Integral membrane protein n=2 Tax=Pediococcus damnosus TaxID=51663 RepID=A0AAC9FJG5_9LACO|nr:Integral membrane protein [Pediococcus damnosus]AMV63480.1 Integral membrane protein [Pediococcus damnosus]AMV65273.1 Integral membrane protein [Pediococcus damnosus]AMV66585.1 Integral membrane protein [Pediococcus damnosus]AMV68874.1 Integral membrane protein [Pediococcus damnosus]